MNQHAKIEELIAAQALDGLDSRETHELRWMMAEHGDDCAECRRLSVEYGEVAGRLAMAVAPDEIPTGMEDRVVALAVKPKRSGFGLRGAIAAVAAAVLLLIGGVGGYLLHSGASAPKVVGLEATGTVHTAPLALVFQPGTSNAFLVGANLKPIPSDHVYELWSFHGKTPSPAGTFRPQNGQAIVPIDGDFSDVDQVAVTIEPAPGSDAPTTEPIYAAAISG